MKVHLLVLYIILGLLFIGLALPLEKIFYSYVKLYKQLNITIIAINANNLLLTESELEKTNQNLKEVKENSKAISYWNYVPFFKNYYADILHLTESTEYILVAWTLLSNHAKTEGLSQISKKLSYQKQIRGEIRNSIIYSDEQYVKSNDVQKNFLRATRELELVDASHFPRFLFRTDIKKQIEVVRKIIQDNS